MNCRQENLHDGDDGAAGEELGVGAGRNQDEFLKCFRLPAIEA